jgi:hypothetical protein
LSTSADDDKTRLEVMAELINQRFELVDKQLESHDEMLGRLLGGLTQLWSGLEALIDFTLDDKPDEEKEKFRAGLQWYASELWKAIKQSADLAGGDTEDLGAVADIPGGERPSWANPGRDVFADRGTGGSASDAEPDRVETSTEGGEDGLDGGDGSGGG